MKFLQASMLVAGFMLLGRVTGFLREIVIAQIGGASQQTDVMIVFLTFPDMMISLLLGGGLAAALVPAFRSVPPAVAIALLVRAGVVIGALFGAIAAVVAIWSGPVLGFIALGWKEDLIASVMPLFLLTLIALPITAVSGVVVAFLNSRERFAFGAIGTLIFNTTLIGALLLLSGLSPVTALTIGILGGVGLRLAVQLAASRSFWLRPDFVAPYDYARLIRRFAGSFGFFSILALLPPIARAIASLIEPGALSMFNYAYKLMELPMAIIVTAIVTVLLPRLSGHVRAGEIAEATQNLGLALRALSVLLMAISIATIFQGEAIVRLVFYGAPFTPEQVGEMGFIVSLGFMGVPFQGLVLLYGTAFVSYDRTGPLMLASGLMALVMASLGMALHTALGLIGLMLAYVSAQAIGAIVLTFWLLRITGPHPFAIALSRPMTSLLLPLAASVGLSWAWQALDIWGVPALLLSTSTFVALHVLADPASVRAAVSRRKS